MCWICEQLWANRGKLAIGIFSFDMYAISLTWTPVYPMLQSLSVLFHNCINKIENLLINQFLNNYLFSIRNKAAYFFLERNYFYL